MPARLKALVWILRPGEQGCEVLLLERPVRRGGREHPVTGKANDSETPLECATREAREETGLTGPIHDLLYQHSFIDPRRGRSMAEHAFMMVAERGAQPALSSEHIDARWATPEQARSATDWPAHREALERALSLWARLARPS